MSVKTELLALLENNRGEFLSGEEIAGRLSVTRSAVWKAIKSLQSEGYNIEGITNKGYSLSADSDMLSSSGIEKYIENRLGLDIEVFKTIGSTNDELKLRAADGAKEGTVIVAEEQTAGKGRKGRSFYSPQGTGLYLSILLRPDIPVSRAPMLTTAAAVAVAKAVESVSGKNTGIKWVNDVWLDGKKICGILTEASMSVENGGLDYAIVGIGVNVCAPAGGFPDELENIAAAVFDNDSRPADARNRLAAAIIGNFMELYATLGEKSFLNEYRERLFVLGKKVRVLGGNSERNALALDIDDECHLKVRYEDGSEEFLSSGEISIKV